MWKIFTKWKDTGKIKLTLTIHVCKTVTEDEPVKDIDLDEAF